MRAVTSRRYGPPEVLQIEDVPPPPFGRGDVRVRVHASTVTSGDARLRGFRGPGIFWLPLRLAFGLARPRQPISGMEFSGVVEAVGGAVTRFSPGDPVFGMVLRGANAELLVVPETAAILPRSSALSDAEAAALPFGALSALVFLRDIAGLRAGERILVVGALGNVGAFALQFARQAGAHVTALCSADGLELARNLGADAVIDRGQREVSRADGPFDVILDTVGALPFETTRRLLTPGGRHVTLSFGLREMLQMLATRWRRGPRMICGFAPTRPADLREIAMLAERGVIRPVIGRVFPMEEAVKAHAHVDSGRKRGSLVLRIAACG
jgi:NADPH:quinone reductase-like Zn-dependent oxidoreductase